MSTTSQALHSIGLALIALAEGEHQDIASLKRAEDKNRTGYATCEPRPQSEVDRELNRLDSANAALGIAIDGLWQKLSVAVFPPAPDGGADGAIEGCGSSLGSSIQHQALRIESAARNLRALTQSLAV